MILLINQINYVSDHSSKSIENRINAFARMKQCVEPAVKAQIQQQSICINCQQLTKKENQKVSPGKLCNWCEKFVCFNCVQQCSKCEFDFCQFCSIQLYDDKDSCKCLSCK